MRPSRVWQNYAVTAAAGAIVAVLGLLSNAATDGACVSESENDAGNHCRFLHAHPAWFLVPAAVVMLAFGLVLFRRSRPWEQYTAFAVSVAVYAIVLLGPWAWIETAAHGGG